MKKSCLLFFLLAVSSITFAQVGFNVGWRQTGETNWQFYTGQEDFLKSSYKVGIDYWFRLKKKRVEFSPEINFSQFKTDYAVPNEEIFAFRANVYGFQFNTAVYPLNFDDDCNCPTFKKDGQLLDKGFHIILSPGVSLYDLSINKDSYKTNSTVFNIGAGVGLDVGLNDYITVTPMVTYHRHFNAAWEDLDLALNFGDDPPANASTTTSFNQLVFAIRLRIRFDEMNKYGYR